MTSPLNGRSSYAAPSRSLTSDLAGSGDRVHAGSVADKYEARIAECLQIAVQRQCLRGSHRR